MRSISHLIRTQGEQSEFKNDAAILGAVFRRRTTVRVTRWIIQSSLYLPANAPTNSSLASVLRVKFSSWETCSAT